MLIIPAYGTVETRSFPLKYAPGMFTEEARLGGTAALCRTEEDITLLLRYSTEPTSHHNVLAEHLVKTLSDCTYRLEQELTGLAVIIAADATGELVPVPQSVIDTAHRLGAEHRTDPLGRSQVMRAIGPAALRAQAMLSIRPDDSTDPDTQIREAIVDLVSYAAALYGRRNFTTPGNILARAVAEAADRAEDDMAAIFTVSGAKHAAPGFVDEASWLVGELLTEAQVGRHSEQSHGFALLCGALLDYMANHPFSFDTNSALKDLGARLTALFAEAETKLGPDGPLHALCWAADRPTDRKAAA
jgi:hypothetical protein